MNATSMELKMANIVKKLQESYSDRDWDALLNVIRNYPKHPPTEAERILEDLEQEEPDVWARQGVISCLKEFDEFGFGRFIKGAKGKKSRFEWHVLPSMIAETGLRENDGQALEAAMAIEGAEKNNRDKTTYTGKKSWTYSELIALLSAQTELPAEELRVIMTIPEARKVLAESQGIPQDDVSIRLG
jgi:hypothetical protein